MTENAKREYQIPSLIENKVSKRAKELIQKVYQFVEEECIPVESVFYEQISHDPSKRWQTFPSIMEELKSKARARGLWNLFLHKGYAEGAGLSNVEYGLMAEIMGRCSISSEAMNCSAPDTGNMEVFAKYGTAEQKKQWLVPLLEGKIRSAFAMTEKGIASSDATNIRTAITSEGNNYVINGTKWWISGAGDPRCKVFLVMGKTNPNSSSLHNQQSILIVPSNTPGITIVRPMRVMMEDDAPHGHMEIIFENVRVPKSNIILGEGRGFEVIQGRLGPGRIHHCMRSIGTAELALEYMLARAIDPSKKAFGKLLYQQGVIQADIANSRAEIDQARFLVLNAADKIDLYGAKAAMKEIALAKVVVPSVALKVIDRAMQIHGAEGLSQDSKLPLAWIHMRTLRFADGPDETHRAQIARLELKRAPEVAQHLSNQKQKQDENLKSRGLKRDEHFVAAKL